MLLTMNPWNQRAEAREMRMGTRKMAMLTEYTHEYTEKGD